MLQMNMKMNASVETIDTVNCENDRMDDTDTRNMVNMDYKIQMLFQLNSGNDRHVYSQLHNDTKNTVNKTI